MSMSSSSGEIMLTFKSSDDQEFTIEKSAAQLSVTIKNLIEDCNETDDAVIPLPNVDSKKLSLVIEYMKKHAECKDPKELKEFDENFVKIDISELLRFLLAINFLNIPSLMNILCQQIADEIKNKTVEEIREIFNVENDFTAEEEAKIRREHAFAFE